MSAESHSIAAKLPANPYPGIRPFRRDEAAVFFGRDDQIDGLVERLRSMRLVAVAGESGCGKSSLVRAGLLPTLEAGFLHDAGARWLIAEMRPGNQPIVNLATALTSAIDGKTSETDVRVLAARLRRGPLSIVELLNGHPLPPDTELLILVDQFEELIRFRSRTEPNEPDAFVALLLQAIADPSIPVRIVLTVRTDYLGECAHFRGLPEVLNGAQYLVPRLEREDLLDAIVAPARVFDGDVDAVLANHIVNAIGRNQDQLPVIEHALHWMWTRAKARNGSDAGAPTLDMQDFEALGGSLGEALSKHAEEIYAGLDEAQQKMARSLLCALWDEHSEERDVRRPCSLREASEIAGVDENVLRPVVDAFRKTEHSLLMPPIELELESETVLDVSHESLFRHWERLADWTRAEAKYAERYRRLAAEATSSRERGRDLLSDRSLEAVDSWWGAANPSPGWARRYSRAENEFALVTGFLAESRTAREQRQAAERAAEREMRRSRLRRILTTIAAIGFMLVVVGVVLYCFLFKWESVGYYRDFIEVRGQPRAIRRIDRNEVSQRQVSYRVVRAGRLGLVKHVYAIGRNDNNVEVSSEYMDASAAPPTFARLEYEYGPDDEVASIFQYSKTGRLVRGRIAIPRERKDDQERSFMFISSKGMPTAVRNRSEHSAYFWTEIFADGGGDFDEIRTYRGRDGEAVPGRDWAFGRKMKYDPEGKLLQMVSVDAKRLPMNDAFGNSGLTYKYDAAGNPIEAVATDAKGSVTPLIHGYAIARYVFDAFGIAIEEALFDERGVPVSGDNGWHKHVVRHNETSGEDVEKYFDEASQPTFNSEGCYGLRVRYDDAGRRVRLGCLSADGKAMLAKDGSAYKLMRYDDRGREAEIKTFDRDDHLTIAVDGYASKQTVYDDNDRVREMRFLGLAGEPVLTRHRYAGRTIAYDDARHGRTITTWGILHEPVASDEGIATVEEELDSFGDAVSQRFFDSEHKPTRIGDGYLGIRLIRDTRGNLIETLYTGEGGGITFANEGYAGFRAEYDDLGRMSRATYLGLRHEPVASNAGVAGWSLKFDAWGNETERHFLGVDGKPALVSTGEAGWNKRYDRLGDLIQVQFVDAAGTPTSRTWGENLPSGAELAVMPDTPWKGTASSIKDGYDSHRRCLREEYFDTNGGPAVSAKGWSRKDYAYDERGNRIRTSYFAGDAPVEDLETKAHIALIAYDNQNNPVDVRYVGLDTNAAAVATDAVAHVTVHYDTFNEIAEKAWFGASEQRVAINGIHRVHQSRNAFGLVVSEELFDVNDKRTSWTQTDFDTSRRRTDERHLDPERSEPVPLTSSQDPCATVKFEYPEEGRELARCLGADGQPRVGTGGFATRETVWGRPGKVIAQNNYDTDGKPLVLPRERGGYAAVRIKYDDAWRQVEMTFFGPNGAEVMTPQGYAKETLAYDPSGSVSERVLYAEGRVELLKTTFEYDAYRRETEQRYFTRDGQPARWRRKGQHVTKEIYDASGKLVELRYRDAVGKPTKGYSVLSDDFRLCGRWIPTFQNDQVVGGKCEDL